MFKKIMILLSLVLFFSTLALTENLPLNTVKQVAKNAYYEFSGIEQNNQILSQPYIISEGNNNLYYVFNIEKQGYIIVSADDRVVPILGYSLTGRYSENGQPPQFQSWMQGYADQVEYVIANDINSTDEIEAKWQKYTRSFDEFTFEKNTKNVDPLLDPIAWDQGNGWNSYCPADNAGPGGHVYAGCVASAAGMVMKYWEHPTTGAGSQTYYCYPYGTISVDFSEATYDWASMADTYPTNAAALLLYHVGVSVQMQYAPDGSGAYTSDLENSLKNNFYYKPSIDFQLKANHPSDWETILVNELDNARPMVYKGSSDASGGHAFGCDGYSSGGTYFHFNWGWSGYYNGYFYLSNLNPGGYYNFTNNQGAVIGIEPDDEPPPTLDPPQNFQLALDSNNVTLTWESPFGGGDGFENQEAMNKVNDVRAKHIGPSVVAKHPKKTGQKGLLGFQVYRDEAALGSQLPADQIEYLDEGLASDTYTYYITAVYDEGESLTTDTLEATITVGVKELQNMISIYPNPVREVLKIELLSNQSFDITLRDVTGRRVSNMEGNGKKAYINVSNFDKGLYFVEIRSGNETLIKKVIIE